MALFGCWYDTAGSESDKERKVLVTAGSIATVTKWEKFDRAWMKVLNDNEVTELHMKYFAHGEAQYKPWKQDKVRRARFLSDLTNVAKRGINKAFVSALPMADYDTVNTEFCLREEIGTPYAVTQALCLARGLKWLHDRKGGEHNAQFFIEQGDTGQPEFLKRAHRLLGWAPIPLPRMEQKSGEAYTPFQLADLIAYEHRLRYNRHLDASEQELRKSFIAIRRMLPIQVGVMMANGLRDWCRQQGVTRRQ